MKKKIWVNALALFIAICSILTFASCGNKPVVEPEPTIGPFDDPNVEYDARQWVAQEMHFVSDKEYEDTVNTVDMDCIFTNTTTGTTYTVPAFWNGGTEWIVRYALTEKGDWTWKTTCTDAENTGLNGKEGTLKCGYYNGDLEIYKHGFIKTETGKHYFMYADGTPFLYIGDTHWSLPMESYDNYNSGYFKISEETAKQYGITSQFKYIMDFRKEQGFTVIQSQQLGAYVGITGNSWMGDARGDIFTYGVNDFILGKFQTLDKYFQYIADCGFVHSHTQFAYPEELLELTEKKLSNEKLEKLCRYWVARYSAYPVMWATSQEGDNDYYGYSNATPENNRWIDVFNYVQKYDPYDHPATCHQENVGSTRVENSAFRTLEGYTFYAMQYSVSTDYDTNQNFNVLEEYWNNEGSLPVVNYEGCYDNFWIGPRGARSQGWCAYLNGVFGHGYGIQPIWEFYWAAGAEKETTRFGETYRMDSTWLEGLMSSGGYAMSYMKKFFEEYEWWKLEPCFDGNQYYTPNGTNYSVATIGNDVYIGYFYGAGIYREIFGTFKNMKKGTYEIKYYDPQTGTYKEDETKLVEIKDGEYLIPGKPTLDDWVIVAKFVK